MFGLEGAGVPNFCSLPCCVYRVSGTRVPSVIPWRYREIQIEKLLRLEKEFFMPGKKSSKQVMPRAVARVKGEETPAQRKKRMAEGKKMKSRR
jgi:hypothetical protein